MLHILIYFFSGRERVPPPSHRPAAQWQAVLQLRFSDQNLRSFQLLDVMFPIISISCFILGISRNKNGRLYFERKFERTWWNRACRIGRRLATCTSPGKPTPAQHPALHSPAHQLQKLLTVTWKEWDMVDPSMNCSFADLARPRSPLQTPSKTGCGCIDSGTISSTSTSTVTQTSSTATSTSKTRTATSSTTYTRKVVQSRF